MRRRKRDLGRVAEEAGLTKVQVLENGGHLKVVGYYGNKLLTFHTAGSPKDEDTALMEFRRQVTRTIRGYYQKVGT